MSANAKTLLNSRVFSLRQRWDSWHFALQMPRRALHAEPTCSCVALRYTSKLAHSAITLVLLAANPICGRRGCSLRNKDLRHRSFFVASAVGFVAFCVANATARVARRTHLSWLTRLLKRHCGDDNKHAYCHKTHLFSQSLTATPITVIKSNEIENQTIVPLNCRLGVIAITLVLLATNPICGRVENVLCTAKTYVTAFSRWEAVEHTLENQRHLCYDKTKSRGGYGKQKTSKIVRALHKLFRARAEV